jgi:hypothetical protein
MVAESIMAILALVNVLTMTTLNTQQTFAMTNTGGGISTGATIDGGNAAQSVDRNLFCNTGIITPICK